MGRQPIPQPCWAAGVKGAVAIESAEHENHGREERELESAGRHFVGARFPLAAVVAAADVTQTNLAHVCALSSHRVTPGIIVSCRALPMALSAFNASHLNVTTCVNEMEHLR